MWGIVGWHYQPKVVMNSMQWLLTVWFFFPWLHLEVQGFGVRIASWGLIFTAIGGIVLMNLGNFSYPSNNTAC